MKKMSFFVFAIVFLASRTAFAGVACNAVISAQESAAQATATGVSSGSVAAMAQTQSQQGDQQGKTQGCFSGLSKFGSSNTFPTMAGLLSEVETMACSMSTGMVMGSVSTLSAPLSAYSSYGISASPGFGQNGITNTPSGPPPILTSTTSSIIGTAGGGASAIFGNLGSSVSSATSSAPGANAGSLPGTNHVDSSVSNSFNNIYK